MYAMGNAIAIGLRKGLVDAGVTVAYDTELVELVIEDGRVVGVAVVRRRRTMRRSAPAAA